jgi:hypothetical protein
MTELNRNSRKGTRPVVKQIGPPENVPVYSCVVYLSRAEKENRVLCRCANLEGLAVTAETERGALKEIVRLFKEKVSSCEKEGMTVPLIDPPMAPEVNESIRYLAVHL